MPLYLGKNVLINPLSVSFPGIHHTMKPSPPPISKTFSPSQTGPPQLHTYSPGPFPAPGTAVFLPVRIWLLWSLYTDRICYFSSCVCLISPGLIASEYTHVVGCVRISFFKGWIIFIYSSKHWKHRLQVWMPCSVFIYNHLCSFMFCFDLICAISVLLFDGWDLVMTYYIWFCVKWRL